MIANIRKTYKYRLYRCGKRDQYLHQQINVAGQIWNHSVALQRRYYRLIGEYIGRCTLQKHIAKLRNRRFLHWQQLDAQAVQDVIDRLDTAYQRFFAWAKTRQVLRTFPPAFKKVRKYKSFTLKQCSWRLLGDNKIRIRGRTYKFVNHRHLKGDIKTVTIKRDAAGRLWICFNVIEEVSIRPELVQNEISTGKIGGFDFGLTTFLTDSEGQAYTQPGFLRSELRTLRYLNRRLSRKQKGSHNRSKARLKLSRFHNMIADKRRAFHFQLAHDLCDAYDVLCFEDLNLNGMKTLWGRKVSDLGFGQFMAILDWVAFKRGRQLVKIDRW